MRVQIARHFTPAVLAEGVARFGIDLGSVHFLGEHQTHVYAGYIATHGDVVLRFTHSSHRSAEWVEAELEWIDYLAQHGVPAARPVKSIRGRWVESIADGEFVATGFIRAVGEFVRDEQLLPGLYVVLGRMLGRMHRLARDFDPVHRRPHWHELDAYDVCAYVPDEQSIFREQALSALRALSALPRAPNTYGLIHSDLHFGNIFVHDAALSCFDFDSCQYHWLGYDVAAILFFSARRVADPAMALPGLVNALLSGYAAENDKSALMLENLELFVSIREIAKYILYYKQDRANAAEAQRRQRLELYRSDIEQGRPFLNVEWNEFVR